MPNKVVITATGMDTVKVELPELGFASKQSGFVQMVAEVAKSKSLFIRDFVYCEASLGLQYDCSQISFRQLKRQLLAHINNLSLSAERSCNGKVIELPAYYGTEVGLDLQELSLWCDLSVEDIIHLHSSCSYQVTTVGFAPGFAYMKGVSEKLRVMRKETPRVAVPAGAIAIANEYTAVYPQSSPGGWWIIGQCPMVVFESGKQPPGLLSVGQEVRFKPIDNRQFTQLKSELAEAKSDNRRL